MPGGKGGAAGVEGAWSSGLDVAPKLAILATPSQFERYIQLVDLCATLLRRRLIDAVFYQRIVSGDPVLSLARHVHRVGTTEWARKIYQMGDASIPVAAASKVLGVDGDSGAPVMKRPMGIDDRSLFDVARDVDIKAKGMKKERAAPKTMSDGIALHPDEIGVESYSSISQRTGEDEILQMGMTKEVRRLHHPDLNARRMEEVDLGPARVVVEEGIEARRIGGPAQKRWRI